MLRPKRLVKLYCIFPKRLAGRVAAALQDIGTVHLIDIKEGNKLLKPLEVVYKEHVYRTAERAKKYKNEIEAKAGKYLLEHFIGPRHIVVEAGKNKERDIVMHAGNFLKRLERKYGEINEKNAKEIKRLYFHKLLTLIERLGDFEEKINALKKFGATKYTASFGGFATEKDAFDAMNALDAASKGRCAFEVKKAAAEDNPPSLLSNPSLIRPFEILTENWGMPSYNGIDPTFILAVTFTLFFGLMFPDIGYGITLAAVSALVYYITRKTTKFVRNLNIILFYCGLSSIVFGFLFGEFLGGFVELKPFLFKPTGDILNVLFISIMIGVTHISIALISSTIMEKRRLHPLALLILLWSLLLFAYTRNSYYAGLLAVAVAAVFYIRGLYAAEEIVSLFTRVTSYLRIGILSIAHITISRLLVQAALTLPKDITSIVVGGILIGIGIATSFAIGIFVVFLQSLRLHWLEFFGSFEFEGEKFEPFRHRKEYLYTLR